MSEKLKPVEMPDGGHCYLFMNPECYGCSYYESNDHRGCAKRIDSYYENIKN